MERYIPTEEERLMSLVNVVGVDDVLMALGIETFRLDGVEGVVVQPAGTGILYDYAKMRPATKDETEMHERSVREGHELEAACGLI